MHGLAVIVLSLANNVPWIHYLSSLALLKCHWKFGTMIQNNHSPPTLWIILPTNLCHHYPNRSSEILEIQLKWQHPQDIGVTQQNLWTQMATRESVGKSRNAMGKTSLTRERQKYLVSSLTYLDDYLCKYGSQSSFAWAKCLFVSHARLYCNKAYPIPPHRDHLFALFWKRGPTCLLSYVVPF